MTDPVTSRGKGWVVFSGVMLTIAGLVDIVNGLWALNRADTAVDTLFFQDDLDAWGWFYVIVGVVVFLAGVFIFSRHQWARWVGILVASIAIVVNMFWVFAYPVASLTLLILNSLVLYGLIAYGGREDAYDVDSYWADPTTSASRRGL